MRSPAKRTSPSSTMSPSVPRFMRSSKRTSPEIARSSVDLPAPFRADQPDELARIDRERDAVQDLRLVVAHAEVLHLKQRHAADPR